VGVPVLAAVTMVVVIVRVVVAVVVRLAEAEPVQG